MKNRIFYSLLLLLSLSVSPLFGQNNKGNIKIEVTDIRSTEGVIILSVYNKEEGFPSKEKASLLNRKQEIQGSTLTYEFTNLPYGEYAVAIIHDENDNGEMDTNFMGIPKEGVGVSNDALRMFGPPKYNDSKFNLDSPEKTITISTHYF